MIYRIIFFTFLGVILYFTIKNINFEIFLNNFDNDFIFALLLTQIFIFINFIIFTNRHIFFIDKNLKFTIAFNAIVLSIGLNYIMPGRVSELIKAT